MLPEPLHAAVVHFPIVFAVLLPVVAAISLVAVRRGGRVVAWWGLTLAVIAMLGVTSFAAVRTGEAQEDRVERVVGERPLHDHEEAGERFLLLTGALLVLGAGGLLPGRAGSWLRATAAAATLVVFAAGWQVGHTGGELVYRHGAASAYTTTSLTAAENERGRAAEVRGRSAADPRDRAARRRD